MRICHLTSAHPRGDVRIFLKECLSLSQSGHEVFLIVADGLGDQVLDGVQIVDVGKSKGRLARMKEAPWRVLKKALSLQADYYHFHDPELLQIASRLRSGGAKVIFDAHEDLPKQILGKPYLNKYSAFVLSKIAELYERRVCRNLDGIVAATPYIRDKFKPINSRVVDVNNYPLLSEFDSIEMNAFSGRSVCYIGAISRGRGICEIVDALALVKNPIQLKLAGKFAEPDLKEILRAKPCWSQVEDLGYVDRQGIRDILSDSLVGLVTLHPEPNYLDSLPVKMFEYMCAGIPVIASDFPLWRDIIESSDCGICVDPCDPAAIAQAIDRLSSNVEEARRMGANGRRAIYEKYNWGNEQAKLVDFYRELSL